MIYISIITLINKENDSFILEFMYIIIFIQYFH